MTTQPTKVTRRTIPALPARPRSYPVSPSLQRSYATGRQNVTRALLGAPWTLKIAAENELPPETQVALVTTLNGTETEPITQVSFIREDPRTLICHIIPQELGLFSFRAEFSLDDGVTWLHDTVPDGWIMVDPPQVDGLRLYTLIPTASGTIADWTADLARIRKMGFNAVHLLPVTTMDASKSPYAAQELFDIDPRYVAGEGHPDSLATWEAFVSEMRRQGLRLCVDLVLNHIGVTSRMAKRAPDWIVPDQNEQDGLQRARYWYADAWHTWDDLVLINYEHPSEETRAEIWDYMTEYALFWANYAHATGGFVRFDNLHSSGPHFIESITAAMQAAYPGVAALAEYFTDERTLLSSVPEWNLNLVLATPWEYKFVPELRQYLSYLHHISAHIRYLMPLTSHDSGTPAEEFGTSESTYPRYAAAALLGTGATGMVQGVEYGLPERIDFMGGVAKAPHPTPARFGDFIRRINAILAEYPAFRRGGNCRFIDSGHPAILAALRTDESRGTCFLVACNFDTAHPQQVDFSLSDLLESAELSQAMELLTGEALLFEEPTFSLTLPPCGVQVFKITPQRE